MRAAIVLVAAGLALSLGGCTPSPVVPIAQPSTVVTSATAGSQAIPPVSSAEGTGAAQSGTQSLAPAKEVPSAPRPSANARAYAKSIGGRSHEGEMLHFIIGASVDTEREAQALLEEAIPKFGDMQSYFIIQRSDNFDGMRPGWWVILEAYREQPSSENRQFGKRGFPGAYVKSATVRTTDPIPVYDDLVPQ